MIQKNNPAILSKYGNAILFIAWFATTLIYLNIYGIVTSLEAGKYIEEAERFINNGAFSTPRFWFYSITLFFMIISLKLKLGMVGAFVMQALLNLGAYLLFYKALKKIFTFPIIPILIIIYLLAFGFYQNWIVFLYTESAFFSLILILFSILILYPPANPKNIFRLILVFILLLLSRPLGILFAGSLYCYLLFTANRKWKWILGAGSILLMVFGYFTINAVFGSLKDWTITQAFEQESIICDMPAMPPYQQLTLTSTGSPVYHLLYYLTNNFSHFLHFAGVKLQYFFLMTRPYYSNLHNYILLFNVIPLYILSLVGLFTKRIKFPAGISTFLLCSIILFALTIVFQCDDYHNRFALSIFPFFVILATKTAEQLVSYFFQNYHSTSRIDIEKPISESE